MKKIICILICVLFSLFPLLSFASATTYRAEGADLSITLPDNMYVFDRKVSPTDERITALGLTYEGLIASFMSQDIYLDALDTDNFNEIIVISEPTDDKDFSDLTPDGLYKAVLAEEKSLSESGRTIEKSDLFELGNIDFVKTVSKANDTHMQYTTVYNGEKIKIRLIDFDSNLTFDEAESFETIVETITFDNPPAAVGEEKEPIQNDEPLSVSSPIAAETITSDGNAEKLPYDKAGKIALIIFIAIIICTIPALVFRFVFTNGGIKKGGAKVLAFFYTIAMMLLFYYIITKHKELNLSIMLCLVPLIWSFVVYKIVKR